MLRMPATAGVTIPLIVQACATGTEQASIGSEKDLFQIIEVPQPAAHIEVLRVVMTVSVRNARPSLWYSLMREHL